LATEHQQRQYVLLITDVLPETLLEYGNYTNSMFNSNSKDHQQQTTLDILYILSNYSNIINRTDVFRFYNKFYNGKQLTVLIMKYDNCQYFSSNKILS
jgi:hypothetical protein